jgi:hypothetical protein
MKARGNNLPTEVDVLAAHRYPSLCSLCSVPDSHCSGSPLFYRCTPAFCCCVTLKLAILNSSPMQGTQLKRQYNRHFSKKNERPPSAHSVFQQWMSRLPDLFNFNDAAFRENWQSLSISRNSSLLWNSSVYYRVHKISSKLNPLQIII